MAGVSLSAHARWRAHGERGKREKAAMRTPGLDKGGVRKVPGRFAIVHV